MGVSPWSLIGLCLLSGVCSAHEAGGERYTKASNEVFALIAAAARSYEPCTTATNDPECLCHANVIRADLAPYEEHGITERMLQDSARYGTRYKIFRGRLYREENCMFPTRCEGVEHFLLRLLPTLPDLDMVLNTRDWPQLPRSGGGAPRHVVLSFSKTQDYQDIMYPAWTFWAGGPAISLHPRGIGRWDLQRERIALAAEQWPWAKKRDVGFFRGSRTSAERDSLVLLSRRRPDLVDAQYTKNQAWKSPQDTLNADPAPEVSFEHHCQHKYLYNFRGVAASFRLKHLFLCRSLVFHVGDQWQEFFYPALKPWVHFVPIKSNPQEEELEEILRFFKEHDSLAREIAERGYEFIWQHLRMSDVECYWQSLLQRFAQLLRYEVGAATELIEIKHKIK